jgi:heterodisulfide reductase subunit C
MISSVIFILVFGAASAFFAMKVMHIRKAIFLGRKLDRTDNKAERWKTMALVALGQKKMFTRPIPAILHLCLYVAFVITQIELIEIVIDGIFGSHRIFRPMLGGLYTFIVSFIEILSVLAFVATVAFLARRNLLKLPRFTMRELIGWPTKDANIILMAEIVLICFICMMNGADEVLFNQNLSHAAQIANENTFGFTVSQYVGPALFGAMSENTLHLVERIGWWGHITMVLGFLCYLPFSKHLHIILAFPNTWYSNLNAKGKFNNMESVTAEVKLMMDPEADPYAAPADNVVPQRFGAKDVTDLTWKNLLDAYSCTECGRCSSSCPASQTGKLLSPRKIMMDTRDRLVEISAAKRKNGNDYDDGKSLLGDYILEEEIWACTSCNACVQECPVNIDPLSIIIDLRRYLVMEESKMPTEFTGMLSNIENNGAPWQFSQANRLNWKDEN